MSNLQNRNQATVNQLSEIQQSIESLKLQLEALNKQFTEATKVANAQANLAKQWKEAIALIEHLDKNQLKKLAILNDFGNSSAVKTIAKKIAETAMTRYRLDQSLQVINPQTTLPIAS